jgi:hypothetical protein
MKIKKQCCNNLKNLLTLIFFIVCNSSIAQVKPTLFKNGQAVFVLKDEVKNPFYWWPTTLLRYQVQFDKPVNPDNFTLNDNTGKQIPFQLTKTKPGSELFTLSVLSGLNPGESKSFVLKAGGTAQHFANVTTQTEGKYITIKTNKLTVQIPNSQQINGAAPGPVMRIGRLQQATMGQSVFNTGTKQLKEIITQKISSGPIFAAYKVKYLFKDGASYSATVKCIQDYDFIELNEEATGIKKDDNVAWKMNWPDFHPTHRQAPNHPYGVATDKPGFARYNWETMDQKTLNYHLGVMPPEKEATKIPFEVGLYEPWPADRVVTSALFWDEKIDQSMGVFITDAAKWNDEDYGIWRSSKILTLTFYYGNNLLSWVYPVSAGTRATAISCYAHQKDIDFMNNLETLTKPINDPFGFHVRTKISPLSYNHFLQNRYGTIHLDMVKDWVLTYPDSLPLQPVVFKTSKQKNAQGLAMAFLSDGYNSELTISGTRQNSGYGPTSSRQFTDSWLNSFNRLYPEMNKEQKARTAAMYLFQAYIAAGEEYMPMKYMLSGHPNFLADVKTIPALAGYQFPKHPEAVNWADQFEKYIDLNTHNHTRPSVKTWDAQGGRWTENLGTYVWAFLRPTLRTGYVLQQSENGRNRIAGADIASVGSWILNALSAPYDGESTDYYRDSTGKLEAHFWGIADKKDGPRRVHPPQGAHAERRKPPRSFWLLGTMLNNYDPLLAEHLRYVSKPTDDDMEAFVEDNDAFNIMYPTANYDKGTKPDFKSIKMTGYGTILRAAVNTPDELSIHLGQIDDGPNYRTGVAGQGGSGIIYFYAGGKSYSHNGREDVGDRYVDDVDLLTTFGVYKNGSFKSIGQNVLSRPLYNLGTGQFTEIVPSKTSGYSWPDYQSRSIMLIGSDYFITYDDVYNDNIPGRFSWFTHPKEELPYIQIIKAGTDPRVGYKKTLITGEESKGVWYDMLGDCLALVSHKKGFKAMRTVYGAKVTAPDKPTDFIFRNDKQVTVDEADMSFTGTAGYMRIYPDQSQELSLFHGSRIGNGDFTITTDDPDAGISAQLGKSGFISGQYYNLKPSAITFTFKEAAGVQQNFFIDGAKAVVEIKGNSVTVHFAAGNHQWQITKGLPIPARPEILYSEDDHSRVHLKFVPSAGAAKYTIELSYDNGETWENIGETTTDSFVVKANAGTKKAHVRVMAINKEHQSEASAAYPVYFTDDKPYYPDGLRTYLAGNNKIKLSWGKVLGVSGYKIYRRKLGEQTYHVVYQGTGNAVDDQLKTTGVLYEYVVSAINKNGDGQLSNPVSTDPKSWLHWDPQPGERFRRTASKEVADKSELYYPK